TRYAGVRFPPARSHDLPYLAALMFGAGVGAVVFGTANLWLSQQQGFARSIEGAVAGGILAVELYKRSAGITERTGARFALPFAATSIPPSDPLAGPFTLFPLLSAAILAYAAWMIVTAPRPRTADDTAVA